MYFVYILFSSKTGNYYVGSAENLDSRLRHHNSGLTPSTKAGAPEWTIKYSQTLENRSLALKRELEIKRKKSRKYIEWLISSTGSVG
ncbi:GIY-YIG nuclease family protein [Algoriphagus terrigena]|uniref:GIY-YIG nuclease family protein n=1 Tax=Algoriphagus terrigena TaxID=344884 RepID=UPI0003F94E06|nr:GIY-YIG nuclease family protein [Algoriphagus terrigena]